MMQRPSPQEPTYRLGLASPEAISQFVDAARKIQTNWSTLGTAEKRASEFFNALGTLLKSLTIPEPTFQLVSLDVYGEFSYQDWKLAVDSRALSSSTISADSFKELADTFYHETRHCEQFFNVARFLANGEKNTAEMIAKTMPIPEAVAKQAKSSPLSKGTTEEENKRWDASKQWYGAVFDKSNPNTAIRLIYLKELQGANVEARKAQDAWNQIRDEKDPEKQVEKRSILMNNMAAIKKRQELYEKYRTELPEERDAFATAELMKQQLDAKK